MDGGVKIVAGILVVVGGVYVLCKTQAGKKLFAAIKDVSPKAADSVSKGCSTVFSAVKEQCSKVADSFAEGYAEVVQNVSSTVANDTPPASAAPENA